MENISPYSLLNAAEHSSLLRDEQSAGQCEGSLPPSLSESRLVLVGQTHSGGLQSTKNMKKISGKENILFPRLFLFLRSLLLALHFK